MNDLLAFLLAFGLIIAPLGAQEISLKRDQPAPYRLYSGDTLIKEYATKEEVDVAATIAGQKCIVAVNYVYTETVSVVNDGCKNDAASVPADMSKHVKGIPRAQSRNETKAADLSKPLETKATTVRESPLLAPLNPVKP